MKKLFIAIFLLGCVCVGFILSPLFKHERAQENKPVSPVMGVATQTSPSLTQSPTPGLPQTISIPSIHLSAPIEAVTVDSQGRMDVPKKAMDTAWYSPGFRPGANGNAVIDGHLDMSTGAPAVFWNVKKLQAGDDIIITDDQNKKYTFTVTKNVAYPYDGLPLQDIFAASATPHLNLITCNGTWDKVNKNYSQRIVVYADLKK